MKVYELSSKEFNENDVLVMASDGLWEQFKNPDVRIWRFIYSNRRFIYCNAIQRFQGCSKVELRPRSDGNAIVPYCSEKWNAEGLRLERNASNRTVPFQNMDRLNK